MQWKVWEHGTVMRPVTAESILSRQTGQVGNSYAEVVEVENGDANVSSVSTLMDETRTTWHVSGCHPYE